jgi:hypothetical protein
MCSEYATPQLQKLACLSDIFTKTNELNLLLKGKIISKFAEELDFPMQT